MAESTLPMERSAHRSTAFRNSWSLPTLVVVCIVAATALLHVRELLWLSHHWTADDGYSHGALVAALVPLLLLQRRKYLQFGTDGRGAGLATAIVVACAESGVRSAGIDALASAFLPLVACTTVWAALGRRSAAVAAAPLAFFLFAVPVWSALTPVLQWITARVASAALAAVGLPVHVEGSFVAIPAGTFEIAGGCSGTSFLVVALALAYLYAFILPLPSGRAAFLGLLAAVIALVANWVRVAVIIAIGEATRMQSPLISDHYAFGWWVFAGAMAAFIALARRWRASDEPVEERVASTAGVAGPGVAAAQLAVACGCLAVGPGLERFAAEVSPAPQLVAPTVKGWRKSPTAEGVWRPTYPGAGAELYVSFERIGDPRQRVVAYAAYYGRQRPGRKLIGYDSSMVGAGWEKAGHPADGAILLPEAVRELELSTLSGRRRLVWMWYEVRGERLLSPAAVRFAQALAAFGRPSRSGVAAISIECESACETARRTLREAYRDGLVALHAGTAEPR